MYLSKLGFIEMVKGSDSSPDRQAWHEGFAHGLHEAEYLTDEELQECITVVQEVCKED
jgi:hypothetical protein